MRTTTSARTPRHHYARRSPSYPLPTVSSDGSLFANHKDFLKQTIRGFSEEEGQKQQVDASFACAIHQSPFKFAFQFVLDSLQGSGYSKQCRTLCGLCVDDDRDMRWKVSSILTRNEKQMIIWFLFLLTLYERNQQSPSPSAASVYRISISKMVYTCKKCRTKI